METSLGDIIDLNCRVTTGVVDGTSVNLGDRHVAGILVIAKESVCWARMASIGIC
jgi:hypothetical protein